MTLVGGVSRLSASIVDVFDEMTRSAPMTNDTLACEANGFVLVVDSERVNSRSSKGVVPREGCGTLAGVADTEKKSTNCATLGNMAKWTGNNCGAKLLGFEGIQRAYKGHKKGIKSGKCALLRLLTLQMRRCALDDVQLRREYLRFAANDLPFYAIGSDSSSEGDVHEEKPLCHLLEAMLHRPLFHCFPDLSPQSVHRFRSINSLEKPV